MEMSKANKGARLESLLSSLVSVIWPASPWLQSNGRLDVKLIFNEMLTRLGRVEGSGQS